MRATALKTGVLALAAATLLALAGCGSDPTAPQDRITLTPGEAAGQAGYLAWALARIGPEFLQDPAGGVFVPRRNPDTLVFTGAVTGSCEIRFETAGGDLTTWDLADRVYCSAYPDAPLMVTPLDDSEAAVLITFDMAADIDRVPEPDTATIDGTGYVYSGSLTTAYTLEDVVVPLSGWPAGGTLTADVGGLTVVIVFDGDDTVTATVDGREFSVSLVNGGTTELP